MRKFHIFNRDGVKVAEHELDDSQAPALLAGFTARIVEVDGEKLAKKSQPVIGPDAEPVPVPEELETEEQAKARREAAKAAKAQE